jgi:outer membrane biosynthesis protein TonB
VFGFWEKIKHRRLSVLLSSYIDGQVSASEAARVEGHLAQCEGCRMELESLRATVALLSGLPELAVPRSFGLTQVPAPAPSELPRRLALTTRFATSVAALLFVALVLGDVLGVVTQGGESVSVQDIPAGAGAVAEMVQEAPSLAESPPGAPAPLAARLPEATPAPAAPQAAPAQAAAPPPVAAMAAPAEASTEDTVAEEAADTTPQPLERAMVQESEEEKVAAAPVEEAVAVEPETVTPKDEAEVAPSPGAVSQETVSAAGAAETTGDDDGIKMPVWQLEAAAGGLFAVLAISTLWMAIRRRRQSGR